MPGEKIIVSACYSEEVLKAFINGMEMDEPLKTEFLEHLDFCHLCQQAVRNIEKQDKN